MFNFFPRHFRHPSNAVFAFIVFGLLLWTPALFMPWWGDDYMFLWQAREARLNGLSWLTPFMTESITGFWRPLSMDTPWRFIETVLKGNVLLAHIFSALLWLLSLLAVANLARRIAIAMQWQDINLHALLAAALYGISAVHFLVLHWVSAINSSILVFFIALPMSLWVLMPSANARTKLLFCVLLPLLQLCALFSKESAILLPAMLVALSAFLYKKQHATQTYGQQLFGKYEISALLLCVLVCVVWFYFFRLFTPSRHSAYGLIIDTNLIKNTLALFGWLFNIPREAVRLVLLGDVATGVLWALAAFVPMAIFCALALKGLRQLITPWQWLAVIAFCGFAYAPYFLLAKQSYEYYAAIVLILPMILLAKGLLQIKALHWALLCCAISSLVAVQGSRLVDYPGVIGRALWAERQIDYLAQDIANKTLPNPLVVSIVNQHQYAALGGKGLMWRLEIPEQQIILADECVAGGERMLQQNAAGDFIWQSCAVGDELKHKP